MYGDYPDSSSTVDSSDVWVLSIPSFQWHRAGQLQRGRTGHSCNVAGHRQMVIIGGVRADGRDSELGDDWLQGLGVFDLSEMVFKDRYNADASAYTSPEVVKKWYADNGSMAKDIDKDVEGLFDRSSSSTADPSTSSVPKPTPTPTVVQSSNNNNSSKSSSVNAGAIAGGVVGGLVFLAAVIAIIWICLRRRRRRHRQDKMHISPPYESDGQPRSEVDGQQTHEKDAQQIHEAEAQQRYELR